MVPDALRTIVIESLSPCVDGGRFPAKRIEGDRLRVEADIFKEGHDRLSAVVLLRPATPAGRDGPWQESPMEHVDNDRWAGEITLRACGRYEYTVEAWTDAYGSWVEQVRKKHDAGEDVASELLEGRRIVGAALERADSSRREAFERLAGALAACPSSADAIALAERAEHLALMRSLPDRTRASRYAPALEIVVDPPVARFGAWYEMFPRSQGTDPRRGATLRECERRLEEIRDLGFDVVYLPPIHPIGLTHRKGKDNRVDARPDDPGSPYAIGSPAGGHMAVEPSLGTLEDFDHFVAACERLGLRVALDFAIQCSPDHPWVREHPEWFFQRPDGTIKYAENPPKKYQDIYALDFGCEAWESLWNEMLRVLELWVGHGVRIFRVDNPHTKPVRFWRWLIDTLKARHPDLVFLSEAFTRPKMMKALAKAGFSQSYTYFTWRNTKRELTEYLTELTRTEMKEYFRGNFFTNTPDILPFFLQTGGRAAFKIRALLAATLSPSWGMYNGFELCEARALPGREEYAGSEKYELKVWDWDRPGNIKPFVRMVNAARRSNPALALYENLEFFWSDSDDVLVYAKATPSRDNVVLVVVNLDPHAVRETLVHVPPWNLGVGDDEPFTVHDLVTGHRWPWRGRTNYVRLDPQQEPAHLFVVERPGR